jgi:DMSO/TMAO reductase YedYZ molybdopterin-dependent catalytic subunit
MLMVRNTYGLMKFKRREFIALTGLAGAAFLAVRYITGGIESISPPSSSLRTNEITPNNEFYLTHYDGIPEIDGETWKLKIGGEVENELSLSLAEIMELPSTNDFNTLICIGNGIGGDLIGNAKWRGIPLKEVLLKAGLKESARELVFHGADGYTDSFPLGKGLQADTRLVYEMNDRTLPIEHGFPLRAVVPGLYGIKNLKWIERIEVSAEEVTGYWQKRGWSKEGQIKVMSRIDMPRDGDIITKESYEMSGIAFAGEHSINLVEVSTDGGKTWKEAMIKPALSRFAWTLWNYNWKVPDQRDYEIMVRARDKSGRTQKEGTVVSRRVFPNGADGYHKVNVSAQFVSI